MGRFLQPTRICQYDVAKSRRLRTSQSIAIGLSLLCFSIAGLPANAEINDLSTGQPIPGTAGITPGPGIDLSNWNSSGHWLVNADFGNGGAGGLNLTGAVFDGSLLNDASFYKAIVPQASFVGSSLMTADLSLANATNANFANANLTGAALDYATLTGADFTGANISGLTNGSGLRTALSGVTGFTSHQLYSTASYQNHDLSTIDFGNNNVSGWSFAGQNLQSTSLKGSDLTGANFSGATVPSSNFSSTNLTSAQLYSTASYQQKALPGLALAGNDLTSWNFAGQNLTAANLQNTNVTGAIFQGAVIASANFAGTALSSQQMYSTASYQTRDLSGVNLTGVNLASWDLTGQKLSGVNFMGANLAGTNFTNAIINQDLFHNYFSVGATFSGAIGFTSAQLYSTASYQNHDLANVRLANAELTGWDFSNQSLLGANLTNSMLVGTNFSDADLSNALLPADLAHSGAIFHNTIMPDHSLNSLALGPGERFIAHMDVYPGQVLLGVVVQQAMSVSASSQLTLELRAGTLITIEPGGTVQLGGTLDLNVAAQQDVPLFVGESFQAFEWNGTLAPGQHFDQIISQPGYTWDTSQLYTTGYVTLTSVPEPATLSLGLFAAAGVLLVGCRRRKIPVVAALAMLGTLACTLRAEAYVTGNNMDGLVFTGQDLSGVNFSQASLVDADLSNTILTNANLSGADLTGVNLANANLGDVILIGANVTGADFTGAMINGFFNQRDGLTYLSGLQGFTSQQLYSTASYQNHDLSMIYIPSADFSGWSFTGQDLHGTVMGGSVLTGARFGGAKVVDTDLAGTNLTSDQLYSTDSYERANLSQIALANDNLSNWNFSNQNLTGASFYGANLAGTNFEAAVITQAILGNTGLSTQQLYSTASYQTRDLSGVSFASDNVSHWDLSNQRLSNADFTAADVSGTNFTNAIVNRDPVNQNPFAAGANFSKAVGFTNTQLYSTASYQNHNLSGLNLTGYDLTGWNFADQDLYEANLSGATLAGANLSGADLIGALLPANFVQSGAIFHNTIMPDHSVTALALGPGEQFIARQDEYTWQGIVGVDVQQSMSLSPTSQVDLVLESLTFNAAMYIEPGTTVQLAGTLKLVLAQYQYDQVHVGYQFQAFNWNGTLAPGQHFDQIVSQPGYTWDTSQLYTTGYVTLTSVPEPSTGLLGALGLAVALAGAKGKSASAKKQSRQPVWLTALSASPRPLFSVRGYADVVSDVMP